MQSIPKEKPIPARVHHRVRNRTVSTAYRKPAHASRNESSGRAASNRVAMSAITTQGLLPFSVG